MDRPGRFSIPLPPISQTPRASPRLGRGSHREAILCVPSPAAWDSIIPPRGPRRHLAAFPQLPGHLPSPDAVSPRNPAVRAHSSIRPRRSIVPQGTSALSDTGPNAPRVESRETTSKNRRVPLASGIMQKGAASSRHIHWQLTGLWPKREGRDGRVLLGRGRLGRWLPVTRQANHTPACNQSDNRKGTLCAALDMDRLRQGIPRNGGRCGHCMRAALARHVGNLRQVSTAKDIDVVGRPSSGGRWAAGKLRGGRPNSRMATFDEGWSE
jgi:hypothetical protein